MSQQLEYSILHLTDRDKQVRDDARKALEADPEASLNYLIDVLQSQPSIRWKALCAFECVPISWKAALPAILPHLRDVNRLCRIAALERIAQMGPEAKAAVPELVPLLVDKDATISALAISGLVRIGLGPDDVNAVTPLEKLLRRHLGKDDSDSREVVQTTVGLLQSIGPESTLAIFRCLDKAVRAAGSDYDDDRWLFDPVFKSLETLLPSAEGISSRLIKLVNSQSAPVAFRRDAICLLGHVRHDDVDRAVNALIDLRTDDEYSELWMDIFYAIDTIGTPAIPSLIKVLNELNETRSVFAAQILGSYHDPEYPRRVDSERKDAASRSIPDLIAAFRSGGTELRMACAYAFGAMGLSAKDAEPDLIDALNDPRKDLREAARVALRRIAGRDDGD